MSFIILLFSLFSYPASHIEALMLNLRKTQFNAKIIRILTTIPVTKNCE